jgi:hypothetical protein
LRVASWLVPTLLPLFAGGCALPAGLVIASYAADGVSYVASGKTVTDHGISAATGHNCAVIAAVINRKPVCETHETERGKTVVVEQGRASVPRPSAVAAVTALDASPLPP